MPRKAEPKRVKQGGKAKAAGKPKPTAKPASKGNTPKLITAAEFEQLLTVEQLIADIAEADAQRARRKAMDAKTGGQYGALCDLADAFAAVLETRESQEIFALDEYPDPASAAKDFVSELQGRPLRVVKAREALLRTGYAVPDEWLTVDVDLPIVRPRTQGRFASTPPGPRPWFVSWGAVPDAAALDRCLRQMRAAMLRFENAPADKPGMGGGVGRKVGSGDTDAKADRKTAREWNRWRKAQLAEKNYKASFKQYAAEKGLNARAVKLAVGRHSKR